MGQVPRFSKFLILGRGRLARHLAHYFTLEKLAFLTWDRSQPKRVLLENVSLCSHVLFAVSDHGIESFYRKYLEVWGDRTCLHFSGALNSSAIAGAHPLMSFADELYTLETYRSVAFVCDQSALDFDLLLPGLKNPHFKIAAADKALYHAWCVLSGNFSVVLWEGFFKELELRFGIPRQAAIPYLKKITENLSTAASSVEKVSVLTGPLVRGDTTTLAKNFASLQAQQSPFTGIYQAFVESYSAEKESS